MEFHVEFKGLKEALEQDLNPANVLKAAQKSIARAAGAGKTIISDQIRQKFNIRKEDLDKKIEEDLTNIQKCEATLRVTGQPINLVYFGPTEIKSGVKTFMGRNPKGTMPGLAVKRTRSRASGGVRVKIIRSKSALLRRAFMAIGRGSHGLTMTPMVFRKVKGNLVSRPYTYMTKSGLKTGKRKDEKLAAYRVITYPSILKQFGNMQSVVARIDEQLVKEFKQNLDYFTKGGS